MLKDRDYDVTPYIIAHILRQIRNGSAKSASWGGDGRRRLVGGWVGGGVGRWGMSGRWDRMFRSYQHVRYLLCLRVAVVRVID